MNTKAKYYIEKLQLQPHPEGGYFKEVYRSGEIIEAEHLPIRYRGQRAFSTSIYFMLEGTQKSLFHKLKSDEIWHYYDGSSVKIHLIDIDGNLSEKILGNDLNSDEQFQVIILKGNWFAAEIIDKKSFAFFGCTVSPGFDFNDFDLAESKILIEKFPKHASLIKEFTRG